MDPINYAGIMQAGQNLVPNYVQQELERRLAPLRVEGLSLQNQGQQLSNQGVQLAHEGVRRERDEQDVFRTDVQRVMMKPTAKGISYLMSRYADKQEGLKAGWDVLQKDVQQADLQTYSWIYSASRKGRWDLAASTARKRYDAEVEAGTADDDDRQFVEMLESEDPGTREAAAGMVGFKLASVVGADKFGSTLGDLGKAETEEVMREPALVKATADAAIAQTDARYREPKLQAEIANTTTDTQVKSVSMDNIRSQIDERAARLDLDRDRLESTVQIELQKLEQTGERLSPGAEKQVTDGIIAAEAARALAVRAETLAGKFTATNGSAGVFAKFGDWAGINGQEASQLRREYAGLINMQAIRNLPPGAASDSDVKMALAGFPPPSARPSTVTGFLKGMAKLQSFAANSEQSKADWIAGNGSIGPAKRDLWVNGTQVPAGTTYGEFSKTSARVQRREKPQNRSYWKYGDGSLLRAQ